MAVKARSASEIKKYWERTWTKMGRRLIHIRDVPAVIELKAGMDEERTKKTLQIVAGALQSMANSPPTRKTAEKQKEFWEATWLALGKQVLFFDEIPAMIELPARLKGKQLSDTCRAMANELVDYAGELDKESESSKSDATELPAAEAVEVG